MTMRVDNMVAAAHQLRSFSTLEALDEVINKFKMLVDKCMYRGKKNFLAVVEHLRRYSCVTKGVSFCKVETMAKLVKVSERTVQRIINRLIELGLVKKRKAVDAKTGRQLANFYQLQPTVDWRKIDEQLSPHVMIEDDEGELVEPSELQVPPSVTLNDRGNDTPYNKFKPRQDRGFWQLPDRGSFLYSFLSLKKQNEYMPDFPFYNWLEEESASKTESTTPNSLKNLPDYLR